MKPLTNRAVVFLLGLVLLLVMACRLPAPQPPAPKPTISEPLPSEPTSVPASDSPTAAATEISPTQTAPAQEPGSNPNNPISRAETLVTIDWEIRVLEVLRGDEAMAMLKQVSAFNGQHEDSDMEYMLVNLGVKYVGAAETAYVYGKIFRSVGSANEIYKSVSFIDVEVPDPELEANLSPGGETEGWVAIQVGKNESGIMLVVWPYVSYENNTTIFSEATPKWYISLEP
ncbi:MAG: DUF4352 domain-containing protein [Anaerolineae bacterium]|nr:DUF4352 domain-containing protein [Anaerolineae bacterium]